MCNVKDKNLLFFLFEAVLPLLKRAAVVNSDKPMSIERAAIVNVSSKLGSIAENTGGAKYPYRCSKVGFYDFTFNSYLFGYFRYN